MGKIRLYPPVAFLLAAALAVLLHRLLPVVHWIPPPWHWLGAMAMAPVAVLAGPGARALSRRETTLDPYGEPSALVTEGPFRYSRNPLYLSLAVLLAGLAVYLGSLSPWLALPLFVGVINRRFIRREEEALSAAFGEDYRAYCRRVRRWI